MNTENIGRVTISVIVVMAFLSYVFMVLIHPVPAEMRDVVIGAGGILGGGFTMVLGYWVGSSAGSSAKDKTITTLSNNKAP